MALVALLAVLVGALHVYPDARFLRELGAAYRGIHLAAAVDEPTYLSRVARVLAGDYRLGNAMIYEHRADPFTYAPLPEFTVGTVGRLLGLSIVQLDVAATAVLPAVVFVLFVLLARELTGRVGLAVLAGLVLTLGHYLLARDTPLLHGQLVNPLLPLPLQFVRPVSPQFHYVVFVVALWLAVRAYAGRAGTAGVLLAGVTLGLSFYLNFFFWTFLVTGVGLWLLSTLVGAEGRWRTPAVILAVGGVLGSYYFVNSARALAFDGFREASLRAGFLYMRSPILPVLHVAWLAVFALWAWRHRDRWAARVLLLLLVAGVICLNQQTITGRTVQPFHWENQTNKVTMVLSLFVVVGALLDWLPARVMVRRGLICAGALVGVLVIAHAVMLQEQYLRSSRDRFSSLQSMGPALAWIRTTTAPDAVVLTNPAEPIQAELVTVYTARYAYLSEPFVAVGLLPQHEVDDRYLVALRTFGFSSAAVQQTLAHTHGSLLLGIHVVPYYAAGNEEAIRRHLEQVATRYRALDAGAQPQPAVFKVDYVLARAGDAAALRHDIVGRLGRVYADAEYAVFAVRRPAG